MSLRIVALVPMRHNSERLPGKNYRLLNGRPLYHYILETLLACPEIEQVVVDTDSPNILQDAESHFPQVLLLNRPEDLRGNKISMNDILLYDVSQVESDFYLQTHCTNPLLSSDTIQKAIRLFLDSYPRCDSLFGVTRIQKFLWDGIGRPINHNPNILLRTQDLPPVYEENSNLYLFSRDSLEARRHRLGQRPMMLEIDRIESWDIDDELEFQIAGFLMMQRSKGLI